MNKAVLGLFIGLLFGIAPASAQEDEIVVTGMRRSYDRGGPVVPVVNPPIVGLRRQADSVVRRIEIISDSRDVDMRKREVQGMLLNAIDQATREGFSLVAGDIKLIEISRSNWKDMFPVLADTSGKLVDDEDDKDEDDYSDDEDQPKRSYEDDGRSTVIRLQIKTKLINSIGNAQQQITRFLKAVPVVGRSLVKQRGTIALTIVNPEQYRDDIYRRVAEAGKHALSFYSSEYSLSLTGLDQAVAWSQVNETDLFLYIPYSFVISK